MKPLRIDHFQLFSPTYGRRWTFTPLMGFRTLEFTESEDNGQLWAAWMQRKGNVHDMAFTPGVENPRRIRGLLVDDSLNIVDLLDLMATTGYVANIERGPGRHGISMLFSCASGSRLSHREPPFPTVGRQIRTEPIRWDLHDPRQTLWGAPAHLAVGSKTPPSSPA